MYLSDPDQFLIGRIFSTKPWQFCYSVLYTKVRAKFFFFDVVKMAFFFVYQWCVTSHQAFTTQNVQ